MIDERNGQRILIVGASGNGAGAETARAAAAVGAVVNLAARSAVGIAVAAATIDRQTSTDIGHGSESTFSAVTS